MSSNEARAETCEQFFLSWLIVTFISGFPFLFHDWLAVIGMKVVASLRHARLKNNKEIIITRIWSRSVQVYLPKRRIEWAHIQ